MKKTLIHVAAFAATGVVVYGLVKFREKYKAKQAGAVCPTCGKTDCACAGGKTPCACSKKMESLDSASVKTSVPVRPAGLSLADLSLR